MADQWATNFYPRPPRGGRPYLHVYTTGGIVISIHALREEGDGFTSASMMFQYLFLSTPSARRATHSKGDFSLILVISIHALREEGDYRIQRLGAFRCTFLSTPSARRATHQRRRSGTHLLYFYPRPPRGGRPMVTGYTDENYKEFLSTPSARRATAGRD